MRAIVPVPAAGQPGRPPARSRGVTRIRLSRALTVLAAVAAGLAGWAVAGPLAGLDLAVRTGPAGRVQHLGPAAVAIASLLAGLAGWALLALLERRMAKARTAWTLSALSVLAVSLAGPLAALTAPVTATLACLHLLVGGVLIAGLRRPADRA